MNPTLLLADRWFRRLRRKPFNWLLPLLAVFAAGVVISQSAPPTPPAIPQVTLASEPLYARGARAKPTLLLSLSVEFPTVGAQYVASAHATEDATYASTNE